MAKNTRWDRNLSVAADAEGLVGHAGAVLLRKLADQCGLTSALGVALDRAGKSPLIDRGMALVSMAVAIALGATSMSDIAVLAHQEPVLGAAPSDTTARRTLELADARTLDKIARARAAVRGHVWSLICARPAGFPWLAVAGKLLAGWLVIDLDATLITARSDKEGAAPTFKMGYGFHPLGAWCANTAESLAMLLRPGNAGSNTFADHLAVLTAALRQIPARMRSRLLVRVDGAGASHELISHLLSLATPRRRVLFTSGWAITAADEQAIGLLPAGAWQAAVDQDGVVQEDKHVAEVTHLLGRAAGWPAGLRWIVRRTKPSRRQARNLTAFEKATGWRYSIICTNIPAAGGIPGVPGSHHAQFTDVLHRQHAVVEDGVRAGKSMGLRNLPSKTWVVNCGWVLAANIAADLAAWIRLLGLYDCEDLNDAEPDTLRYRLLSLPARLVRHARARVLKISRTWPWKDAFLACWHRLCALPAPA
ncbi:MAG TPA: IS1380 family transposase [Streptosporangiaceae bacterium]|nr:IS1380 family transposase [Streptosporangiaceae bacterium]HYA52707.1 IS1380 family transposase [Streptosporangiaceae bacterium]